MAPLTELEHYEWCKRHSERERKQSAVSNYLRKPIIGTRHADRMNELRSVTTSAEKVYPEHKKLHDKPVRFLQALFGKFWPRCYGYNNDNLPIWLLGTDRIYTKEAFYISADQLPQDLYHLLERTLDAGSLCFKFAVSEILTARNMRVHDSDLKEIDSITIGDLKKAKDAINRKMLEPVMRNRSLEPHVDKTSKADKPIKQKESEQQQRTQAPKELKVAASSSRRLPGPKSEPLNPPKPSSGPSHEQTLAKTAQVASIDLDSVLESRKMGPRYQRPPSSQNSAPLATLVSLPTLAPLPIPATIPPLASLQTPAFRSPVASLRGPAPLQEPAPPQKPASRQTSPPPKATNIVQSSPTFAANEEVLRRLDQIKSGNAAKDSLVSSLVDHEQFEAHQQPRIPRYLNLDTSSETRESTKSAKVKADIEWAKERDERRNTSPDSLFGSSPDLTFPSPRLEGLVDENEDENTGEAANEGIEYDSDEEPVRGPGWQRSNNQPQTRRVKRPSPSSDEGPPAPDKEQTQAKASRPKKNPRKVYLHSEVDLSNTVASHTRSGLPRFSNPSEQPSAKTIEVAAKVKSINLGKSMLRPKSKLSAIPEDDIAVDTAPSASQPFAARQRSRTIPQASQSIPPPAARPSVGAMTRPASSSTASAPSRASLTCSVAPADVQSMRRDLGMPNNDQTEKPLLAQRNAFRHHPTPPRAHPPARRDRQRRSEMREISDAVSELSIEDVRGHKRVRSPSPEALVSGRYQMILDDVVETEMDVEELNALQRIDRVLLAKRYLEREERKKRMRMEEDE